MRLSTFIASKENVFEDKIVLKDNINHLKNVLRLKIGDEVRIVDSEKEYICRIDSIEKERSTLSIIKIGGNEDRLSGVTAAIAIIKSQNFSIIVKELTELGISRLIPIYTKRSSISNLNIDKWIRISREALKQCRGIKFMDILPPENLRNLNFEPYDFRIFAYEKEKSYKLIDMLREKKFNKSIFIIGPEGGFDDDEANFLKINNFLSLSLGSRVLRTETASILLGGILINGF